MADLNVDAALIKEHGALVHAEENLVEMQNGCICCTLREDLFAELAKLASQPDAFDHVLIESSGVSEPLPVAETFTFTDDTNTSLGDVARLDTLVTVVDGASCLDELCAADRLKARGWEVATQDERTVAQLFCNQLEFANVIVMNKMDLLDAEGRKRLEAILRRLNPTAQLIEATRGVVDPSRILGTGLFDLQRAAQHPEWLKEARIGEHAPESVEYGISSFVFRSQRPFNPTRFDQLTDIMKTPRLQISTRAAAEAEPPCPPRPPCPPWLPETGHRAAQRVVRAKGVIWYSAYMDQHGHWYKGTASLAGRHFTVAYEQPWSAHASGLKATSAAGPWGDRGTELVVIGQDMDHGAMAAALQLCVMTRDEMDAYADIASTLRPPQARRRPLEDDAPPAPGPKPTDTLTYKVGDRIRCSYGDGDWVLGKVVALWFREEWWDTGRYAPYQVEIENADTTGGRLIYVPYDRSSCIRPA